MMKIENQSKGVMEQPLLHRQAEDLLNSLFPKREIKKILLVTPPDADASLFRLDTAQRHRYTNYPPYGLATLAHHLRSINIEVRITNLNHEVLKQCIESKGKEFDFEGTWKSKLNDDICSFQPDFIGVTCMFTMTHTSFKEVCQQVTKYNIPLAIGGVHVSNDVERILDSTPAADVAFLREGEVAIKQFIRVVNRQLTAADLVQVILIDRKLGARYRFLVESVPSSEEISVIPTFDLLDIPNYSNYGTIGSFYCFKPVGTRFATVLSNRGCRAQCTFCSVRNFNGVGVRQRTIESVIKELELLRDKYGVGHIMWLDDDLLLRPQRAIALFNEMAKRNLNLTWDATNGVIAASCTDEVIGPAAESGCIALNIGMESGNPSILRQVKKPGTVETFLRAAEVLRKYQQIHSSVFLMIGFPGETMSMIFDTINVAREMDLDWYRISQLQPLPNTPIYDSMVAQGLIQDVGSKDVRFMGGPYGKQADIEQGLQLASASFKEAFENISLDSVPTREQLTDIWFYMNYHLNFHRLFSEERMVKIEQQIKHLRVLSDIISPENGFALYFLGYLQYKVSGRIEPGIVERLQHRLATSPYWQDRFTAFGLSAEDLITCNFKNRHIQAKASLVANS